MEVVKTDVLRLLRINVCWRIVSMRVFSLSYHYKPFNFLLKKKYITIFLSQWWNSYLNFSVGKSKGRVRVGFSVRAQSGKYYPVTNNIIKALCSAWLMTDSNEWGGCHKNTSSPLETSSNWPTLSLWGLSGSDFSEDRPFSQAEIIWSQIHVYFDWGKFRILRFGFPHFIIWNAN